VQINHATVFSRIVKNAPNNKKAVLVLIGALSLSEARWLPPYWDKGLYGDTWRYTGHPRLVNET